VALARHEHGRHGHDGISSDPVRYGAHGASGYAVAGDGVHIRFRHVDRDDGRHDDALGSAHDSHVRPCGPANSGAWQATRCNCLVRYWLFLVWIAFALLATLVQWAFERTVLLEMATTSTVVGGLLFVAAGSYQWTRLKDACLTQCQKPFAFLMRQGGFRGDVPGALMLGVRHGAYCVGCCWALMALLLVGGVMNVLWIVLLALLILLEKVAPFGRQIALLAGVVLIAAGMWLFSMGMS
jgi:predicted metal-binding membrane protein